MPALDWIFVGGLLASLLVGAWRGLVFEVLSLISWVVAFIVAQWWAPNVADHLPMAGASEMIRYAAAYVLVFIGVVLVMGVLAWLMQKLVASVGLRPVDRVLGAAFGLARGVVVLLALVVAIEMTPLRTSTWWQGSAGVGVGVTILKGLQPVLPERFGRYLPKG